MDVISSDPDLQRSLIFVWSNMNEIIMLSDIKIDNFKLWFLYESISRIYTFYTISSSLCYSGLGLKKGVPLWIKHATLYNFWVLHLKLCLYSTVLLSLLNLFFKNKMSLFPMVYWYPVIYNDMKFKEICRITSLYYSGSLVPIL